MRKHEQDSLLEEETEKLLRTYEVFLQQFVSRLEPSPIKLMARDIVKIREMRKAAKEYENRTGEVYRQAYDMGRILVMRGYYVGSRFVEITREEYHKAPARKGMFRHFRCMDEALEPDNVLLLKGLPSKQEMEINPRLEFLVRSQAQIWLDFHNFYGLTRFKRDNLVFAQRDQKFDVCRERIIRGLVDDRGEVIQHAVPGMNVMAMCPVLEEWKKYPEAKNHSQIVRSPRDIWDATLRFLRQK